MAIDSAGNVNSLSAGEWTSGNSYRQDTYQYGSTPLTLSRTVPVAVQIHSTDGPMMEGARITNGCNMRTGKADRCFGPTQAENFVTGLLCLLVGVFLLCTPCLLVSSSLVSAHAQLSSTKFCRYLFCSRVTLCTLSGPRAHSRSKLDNHWLAGLSMLTIRVGMFGRCVHAMSCVPVSSCLCAPTCC